MSRIYEALKRAESERMTSVEAQPRIKESADSAPSIRDGMFLAPKTDLPPHDPAVLGPGEPSLSTPPAFDLQRIPKRPWNPSSVHLPALLNQGALAEQFRGLGSRLVELRHEHPLKVLLISSGLPREGKSFIAANLAISLARRRNSRVLLIDGDMRHSTLHALLGCEWQPSLCDYLAGKASALEVIQEADPTHSSGKLPPSILQNLFFIPGGNGGAEAADLSSDSRFAELIATVASSFEWIVVDSSPVISASDTVNLARACDGVLLVARAGTTPFQAAQRAQKELQTSNILGLVLNGADGGTVASYYHGTIYPEA